jgi:hypothetical protein
MVTTLLSWGWSSVALGGPIRVDTVPGDQTGGTADWAYKLDILDIERTSILVTMAPWLEYAQGGQGGDELHLAVYQEDTTDDWDLVWDSGLVGPVGRTGLFFGQDPGIVLEAGRRYAIGMVFEEGNYDYRYESGPGVTGFGWARHVGAIYVGENGINTFPSRITNQTPSDLGYWMELTVEVIDVDGDGVTEDTDCDDLDAARFPGSPEYCDGIDNDCTGSVDDNVDYVQYWPDVDGDGFGDDANVVSSCDPVPPADHLRVGGDCDDTNGDVHPGVPEYCDGVDDDCSGVADDDPVTGQGFEDLDGDGFGGAPVTWCTREQPEEIVDLPFDCDDTAADTFPAALEVCDGRDQDCDEVVDDGLPTTVFWRDLDLDGAGDPAAPLVWCEVQPDGYVSDDTDCDDTDPRRTPGNEEVCDGIDNDCDGLAGGEGDFDGDGFVDCLDCASADPTTFPGAPEACDGIDHDCDGVVHTRLECDPAPTEVVSITACSGCSSTTNAGGAGWLAFLTVLAAGTRRRC